MDDARSRDSANAAEFALAMMQESIHEGMLLVSYGWMHDESWRFIQDQQNIILEENIERYFFRLSFRGFCLRPVYFHLFSGVGRMSRLDLSAVHEDMAFLDKPLNGAP
jgi:hypothetical protein